ncbi:MAG: hypothetical protein N3E52_00320 [Candidatus Bathyarchaeota archaeon]|nr:hypothetical protein [Candidatus Bathyarchaeota archaeon]
MTQASQIEQLNAEQKAAQQTLLVYGIILTVVTVAVVAMILVVMRKKRKRLASEISQPNEAAEEFSAEQT